MVSGCCQNKRRQNHDRLRQKMSILRKNANFRARRFASSCCCGDKKGENSRRWCKNLNFDHLGVLRSAGMFVSWSSVIVSGCYGQQSTSARKVAVSTSKPYTLNPDLYRSKAERDLAQNISDGRSCEFLSCDLAISNSTTFTPLPPLPFSFSLLLCPPPPPERNLALSLFDDGHGPIR